MRQPELDTKYHDSLEFRKYENYYLAAKLLEIERLT